MDVAERSRTDDWFVAPHYFAVEHHDLIGEDRGAWNEFATAIAVVTPASDALLDADVAVR